MHVCGWPAAGCIDCVTDEQWGSCRCVGVKIRFNSNLMTEACGSRLHSIRLAKEGYPGLR